MDNNSQKLNSFSSESQLAAALRWRRRGFRVLPVLPDSKKPALKWGEFTTDQTDDRAKAHWTANPDHLVAVVADDCFIIDTDTELAEERYQGVIALLGPAPFCTMKTRRGHHYYYRLPKGFPRVASRGDSTDGYIDIKTGKSYVVVTGPGREELEYRGADQGEISFEQVQQVYQWGGEVWPFVEHVRTERREWGGDEFELGEAQEIVSHFYPIDELPHVHYETILSAINDYFEGADVGCELICQFTEDPENQRETEYRYFTFTPGKQGGRSWSSVCHLARAEYGADLEAIAAKWRRLRGESAANMEQEFKKRFAGVVSPVPVSPIPSPVVVAEPKARIASGTAIYNHHMQEEVFAGCVYVSSHHGVLMPNGSILAPERFNAMMPGGEYDLSQGKTTRKPFEAFTGSHFVDFPKADRLAFRPERPQREITKENGLTFVNAFVPAPGARAQGDVMPFLRHLELLLPDSKDREILLSWCAAVVQKPGIKAKWAPVLIGTQGNGKSLIGDVLAYAVGRNHTVKPRADQLGGRFNSWIENKLLAVIEEIHTQGRREVMDALKPLITEERIEVEGKGRDALMVDNRCNMLMCSNHRDAIMKTKDDRRYAVFYCAQQSAEDKQRDGMDDLYFKKLFTWLEERGGFAAVAHYLDQYVPSVSIRGCSPHTSGTEQAIEESRSPAQQAVLDAVDMEQEGFTGGMITAEALGVLLKDNGIKVSTRTQGKLMDELGYRKHPMLPDGKIWMLGRTVRVYSKKGHPVEQVRDVRAQIERQQQAMFKAKFAQA
ncbi:TPA: bifunctional DNA primase/polymerase [Aeromonas dhakensis]|nr:bifunctional DNA primase/polymerase [Aeromonas dhakensis]